MTSSRSLQELGKGGVAAVTWACGIGTLRALKTPFSKSPKPILFESLPKVAQKRIIADKP